MKRTLLFLLFPFIVFGQRLDDVKKADEFKRLSVHDSAMFYYKKAIEQCRDCSDKQKASLYLRFGKAAKSSGNTPLALENYLLSEEIYDKIDDADGLFEVKTLLAEFFRFLEDLDAAYRSIEEAKSISQNNQVDKKILAYYFNRRAAIVAQLDLGKDKVLELSKECLAIAEELQLYKLMIYSYNEIAYIYEQTYQIDKVKPYYQKAYDIAKQQEYGVELCDVIYRLYNYENLTIELDKSAIKEVTPDLYKNVRAYLEEGLALATKINYLEKQSHFSRELYQNYLRTKEYKRALAYFELYHKYEDQFTLTVTQKEVSEIRAKYELEKKDALLSKNKNEIQLQYLGLMSFGFILILMTYFYLVSKRDKANIQSQKSQIEDILSQKIVLLKEVHHRVKNNLQLISGLLYLQSTKHDNSKVTKTINEAQKQIDSIALVHEMLYKDDNLSLVAMDNYLRELGERLLQIASQDNITYELKVSDISLPIDHAITLGLVMNELVMNSIKYAFGNGDGKITVGMEKTGENQYRFSYADNGCGFDVEAIKDVQKNSLGQRLVSMLAEEINAKLSIYNDTGITYIFDFKTTPI